MCHAGPRYEPVITGHTVRTRAVTNVWSQARLYCDQGVTSVCALWTTRLGISGAIVISERVVQWLWNDSAKTQIVSEEFVNYKTLSFSIIYILFDTSRVLTRQFLGS